MGGWQGGTRPGVPLGAGGPLCPRGLPSPLLLFWLTDLLCCPLGLSQPQPPHLKSREDAGPRTCLAAQWLGLLTVTPRVPQVQELKPHKPSGTVPPPPQKKVRSIGRGHITGFWRDWDREPQPDLTKGIMILFSIPGGRLRHHKVLQHHTGREKMGCPMPQEEGTKAKSIT